MTLRTCFFAFLALAGIVLPGAARAEMASLFGIGPVSSSMGGTALQEGHSNPYQVYSAPAALGFLRTVEVSVAAQYMAPGVKPFGTLVLNSNGTLGQFNTAGVLPGGGSILGFALPIGKERPLVLGGAIYLPFSTLLRVSGSPVDYPFYPLYNDISRNFFFVLGAGYELFDGWSLGLNVRSTTHSNTSYVLRSDSSVNYSASAVEARSDSRLSYSFVYDQGRRHPEVEHPFSAGAMYRAPAGMESKLGADVTAFVPVQGQLVSMPFYTPAEWVLMGSWKAFDHWTFSGDFSWVKWSKYVSPYGVGNINSYAVGARQQPADFHDVAVYRLGAEREHLLDFHSLKRLVYRAGYQIHPSPAPDQHGDTNFVDNNRQMFSAGLGLGWLNPWREASLIDLDFFFQYNWLLRRQVVKDTSTNVGSPGYSTGGNILLFGAGGSLRF
jgi:Outer membrane protein transport protein (OMPP1/FadL/TodX)